MARGVFALLLLGAAIGYAAYSAAVYRRLRPRYVRMRFIADSRPEGAAAGGQSLPPNGAAPDAAPDAAPLAAPDTAAAAALARWQGPAAPEVDVPELLSKTDDETRVVEDMDERLQWHALLRQVRDGCAAAENLEGSWRFCFRDYVTEEELAVMASRRGAFAAARLRGATRLDVAAPAEPGGEWTASLRDAFDLLGAVPVAIEWRGRVARGARPGGLRFDWEDTSLRLGWRWLGRTVERPAMAEKMRQEPWEVEGFFGGDAGGAGSRARATPALVALRRAGVGTLAFRRL